MTQPRLKSIAEEWEGYSEVIFQGVDPTAVQVEETKKAFYAGVLVVLNSMNTIGMPHVSEEEGIAWVESRWKEVQDFFREYNIPLHEMN